MLRRLPDNSAARHFGSIVHNCSVEVLTARQFSGDLFSRHLTEQQPSYICTRPQNCPIPNMRPLSIRGPPDRGGVPGVLPPALPMRLRSLVTTQPLVNVGPGQQNSTHHPAISPITPILPGVKKWEIWPRFRMPLRHSPLSRPRFERRNICEFF